MSLSSKSKNTPYATEVPQCLFVLYYYTVYISGLLLQINEIMLHFNVVAGSGVNFKL